MHIEYELTEKELLDYNFYTGWQMPEKKSIRLRYYTSTTIIYIIVTGAFLYLLDKGELQPFSVIIVLAGALILLLTVKYRIRSVFDKRARKLVEQSGPGTILSKTELLVDKNGIYGKTKNAEVRYTWDAFKKKVLTNDCYYLYTNIQQALVIPLRSFSSPEELKEFEQILLVHFPLQAELESLGK